MRTVKLEEKTALNKEKVTKGFGMSKKGAVNLVLRNLSRDDIFMYMKRESGVIFESPKADEDEDWDEIEFDDDDNNDVEFEEEGDEEEERGYFDGAVRVVDLKEKNPAERRTSQLKLDAMKAGFVTEEEIDLYVKRETG